MDFTHLHVHTGYSLLDGSGKISDMVNRAKELGFKNLAITDHGVMYGVIDFYDACLSAGIKPVIGCEVYVAPGSRFEKEGAVSDDRYYHLILLAENNEGYRNLMKIVSKGFTEGFYYKPRIDHELLEKYHEGIIALSACLAGEIPQNIVKGFYEEAKETALWYNKVFGEGNFFLELQDHGIAEQKIVNQALLKLHNETGISLVATNDVHYVYEEDWEAHDVLLCIQTQRKVSDENRMRYAKGKFYLKSAEEMYELFPYAKEALENTERIAERCNVEIEFGNYKLPKFDVPEGRAADEYLNELCMKGLKKRYPDNWQENLERMEYELGVIKKMGFVDYFLIVSDFIRYAKDNDIPVGPGRGSAAGSLVSYCLEITELDPIRYQLLFERFLNPERVTMPDIDVDFCYARRQEVIDYVVRKYGTANVVQIVTFGTLAARGVIRDVGRAMDLPYSKCDTIAKMIPQELNITIDKAIEENAELRELIESDPEVKELVKISKRLEGLPRHTSIHAAGVVISNAPAEEYVPLQKSADDIITTQYTMVAIERLGLLKMDFLGLRNLTVIKDVENMVRKRVPEFAVNNISYDDAAVYELISSGKTSGIFQLESAGMSSFMKELAPGCMEDVIAGISLYRPGPMDFIPKYIKGKNNRNEIEYDCKELVPILEPTYGCIVYQEQVMQIVRELAGYTYGQSDNLRRAMSKKKDYVMKAERQSFVYGDPERGIPGCAARGISEDVANKIYDEMVDFAKYAFNKSHAACYAVLAYQTAYLKKYYPVEFMAALLTSVIENTGKLISYIQEAKQMGIKVLPPDINVGRSEFSVEDGKIYYGLVAIKGLGRPVIASIVNEREKNGPYRDIKDFCERTYDTEVGKRTIENLIKAGAFDSLPGNRRQLMQLYPDIVENIARDRKKSLTGQMNLFDLLGESDAGADNVVTYPDLDEYEKAQLLFFEKEVLGMYVSGHPLEQYEEEMNANTSCKAVDFVLNEETGLPELEGDKLVILGGMVTAKTMKTTKHNEMMCFFTLEDVTGSVEVIAFPKTYERYRSLIFEDAKIYVRGRVSVEDDKNAKLICQDVVSFDEIPGELWIKYPDINAAKRDEASLNEYIVRTPGLSKIVIYCEAEKALKKMPDRIRVGVTDLSLSELKGKYGEKNVSVKKSDLRKIWNI
ncbi:MAG: DNA polymerase III subunit alpha [Lachnospiraceae bacterium]|nr:DNA polymerase III subunit alpha [Lachnospiraceae bacterium]